MTMLLNSPTCIDLVEQLREKGIEVSNLGGNCPVQAEGSIEHDSGKRVQFYFRARGNNWSIEIGRKGREMADDTWAYHEPWPGDKFAAGYMAPHEALPLIERGVLFWRRDGAPLNPGHNQEHLLAHLGRGYDQIERLGFHGWLEQIGKNEGEVFCGIHGLGTPKEDAIEKRLWEEKERYQNRAERVSDIVAAEGKAITKWLLERRERTIANILEMQR